MTDHVPQPARTVTEAMLQPNTPETVVVTASAGAPADDPTLGIQVEPDRTGQPRNRLVTIGDSLTHGFQSGAVFNTDLSYPAIIAYELGWYDQFRRPNYPGFGGLPLNIEFLLRDLEARYGESLNPFEVPLALFRARQVMAELEDYYERGAGSQPPNVVGVNHNLGVYGWDLRDTLVRTAKSCQAAIGQPKNNWLNQLIENANERAALRVLPGEQVGELPGELVGAQAVPEGACPKQDPLVGRVAGAGRSHRRQLRLQRRHRLRRPCHDPRAPRL